ncbi:TetR/AcrR family transcriptional regulator [Sphingobium amiense]|uniref:TetR/AcrR family transcriptional regulator n=2 Tax=Sphingobium amiense TaxID=135719 RepID=A0A494WFH8_9SPHN|nr:TetR/AcrR family transcriptional regulator [Sphingobium amiense]BBD99682.1 TetR/AcrR family transcriptional regulator [Sphingobium amiense]
MGGTKLKANTEGEDFRVRSAARKRERMRAKLLEATMAVCAERGPQAAIIEDVLNTAGVSRGTFYAHFDSLQKAIATLGHELADEAVHIFRTMYEHITDPVLHTAVGPQLVLTRAMMEPSWGKIIAQSEDFSKRSDFVAAIRGHLVEGRKRGDFRLVDVDAAVDLHIGALVRGAEQLQAKKRGRATYIREVSRMLLLAAGTSEQRALEAARWAEQDLKQRAPGTLSWWRSEQKRVASVAGEPSQ